MAGDRGSATPLRGGWSGEMIWEFRRGQASDRADRMQSMVFICICTSVASIRPKIGATKDKRLSGADIVIWGGHGVKVAGWNEGVFRRQGRFGECAGCWRHRD